MKTPSDELFKLIKSLSKDEKRLFKIFSKQTPEENGMYLQLFDAMDALERYDEKEIAKIFGKKRGLNTIRDAKKYLKESIYRFLEYYYFDYSADIQLHRSLQRAEILYTKRLFLPAEKHLVKAEKAAVGNHHFLHLLHILAWKREIIIQQRSVATYKTYEQEYYSRELHYIDLYKNLVEYQKIYVRIGDFSDNLDKKAIGELKEILKTPLLKNEKMALSFPAKVMYCRILGDMYSLLGNWKKSYTFLWRAAGYLEQAGLSPVVRLRIYANITVPMVRLKKSDELLWIKERATALIRSQPEKLKTISLLVPYLTLMNNCVHYQLSIIKIDEALSTSDEIMKWVEKYGSTQIFLLQHGNRSCIFFLKADYRKALYHSNRVLSAENMGVRMDIISYTKIFNLIIHYELGNEDMLPNLCKSYFRYFGKQSQKNKAEYLLLNFFGRTIHKNTAKYDRLKVFTALKKELELCKKENIFYFFDFISWAESKIENRPLVEILKEKS